MTVNEYAEKICKRCMNPPPVDRVASVVREAMESVRERCICVAKTAHDSASPAGKIAGETVGWDKDRLDEGIVAAIRALPLE